MAKNKKLIIFIPSIEDGGVEKNLFIISNYLIKKIENIILITYNNSQIQKFDKKIKIITPFFNFINFKGRYPKYIFCLITLFVVLLFDKRNLVLSFQANIFSIIICKILKIKILSRSNSSSTGWSQNKFKQFIFSYFFKKTDKLIVNSHEFKKEIDKKYNVNSECILNPFEFNKIKKLSKEKSINIYNNNKIKLISVGRLTEQKDYLTTLRAIKNYKKDNIQLAILGKGHQEKLLKKFCKENELNQKVKFLGYKKNPFKYIKQADILILSSLFEGSPNVLIEALFLKKYIIATNCPTGPKEILHNGKFGKLVEIGDYVQISKSIKNFKKNKKVNNQVKAGFKSLKKYDFEQNCKKYYDTIREFL